MAERERITEGSEPGRTAARKAPEPSAREGRERSATPGAWRPEQRAEPGVSAPRRDTDAEGGQPTRARRWVLGLTPVVLLGALVFLFRQADPTSVLRTAFPPLEELTIERVGFPAPERMLVHVVNGGPEPVTIAQLMVDEAYWQHSVEPDRVVPRLGRALVSAPYPWVEGEPLEVVLVTSTGLTFAHEVEVATLSPQTNARYLGVFALLGMYAGVVPVLIGLLWYPYLRQISRRWLHFFLSLTAGLLIFLAADSLAEAFEVSAAVPEAFQGVGLIVLGSLGAVLVILGLGHGRRRSGTGPGVDPAKDGLRLAYLVALGIGLHNLGEGLAIGSAFALGEIALGSFLVIGFAIHNTTEGLAIVAPVAAHRPRLYQLAAMGALAGVPTILGTWIGGFSYSPIAATFFLAVGAGAMLVVVYELWKMMSRQWEGGLLSPLNAAGLGLGLIVMYGTALLVVA